MDRRRFLASVALAAGVAGCNRGTEQTPGTPLGSSSRDRADTPSPTVGQSATATASPTAEETPTSRTTPTTVPETNAVLRTAYRHLFYADSFRFVEPDEAQFAFVQIPEASAGNPPSGFELVAGDERFDPDIPERREPLMPRVATLYTEDEPSGWLAFDLPVVTAENAYLDGPDRRYALPEDFVTDLAAYPLFTVESVLVPRSVEHTQEEIHVAVVVRNASNRAGTFLAGVGGGGLYYLMSGEIPAGETGAVTGIWPVSEEGDALYFFVSYPDGGERFEVPITGRGTATSTETTAAGSE